MGDICDLSRKKGTISIFHTFTDFYVIPFSNVRSIKIWISEVYKLFGEVSFNEQCPKKYSNRIVHTVYLQ